MISERYTHQLRRARPSISVPVPPSLGGEMVDTMDSKSIARKGVSVQVRPKAPKSVVFEPLEMAKASSRTQSRRRPICWRRSLTRTRLGATRGFRLRSSAGGSRWVDLDLACAFSALRAYSLIVMVRPVNLVTRSSLRSGPLVRVLESGEAEKNEPRHADHLKPSLPLLSPKEGKKCVLAH